MNRRRNSPLPCGWNMPRITAALAWLAIVALLLGAIAFWI